MFASNSINPMSNFFLRHAKAMGFVATESIHNVMFHVIETVKVRGQARNLVSGDISHYFKNQVEKKPLISGIVSGFLGAASGAVAFQTMFTYLTIQFYCNQATLAGLDPSTPNYKLLNWMQNLDFRTKNLIIYAASDFTGSIIKVQFEVRKLLIQMYSRDAQLP